MACPGDISIGDGAYSCGTDNACHGNSAVSIGNESVREAAETSYAAPTSGSERRHGLRVETLDSELAVGGMDLTRYRVPHSIPYADLGA